MKKGFVFIVMAMVSGTIKRQKGHFVHAESTTNFIEWESQKSYEFEASSFYAGKLLA
jgi:hypothetical protein